MPSTNNKEPTTMPSFYRRPLPSQCISFSSQEGKALFTESLHQGFANAFFPLIEQYHTQQEPAYCGLGTLSMILNALSVDPQRPWKGVWRWFSEELLDCCVPLERIQKVGITMEEFVCLAKCNGAIAEIWRDADIKGQKQPHAHKENACIGMCSSEQRLSDSAASSVQQQNKEQVHTTSNNDAPSTQNTVTIEDFRRHIQFSTSVSCHKTAGCEAGFIAVSYSRKILGQTGTGHFSPIGAYYQATEEELRQGKEDMVLVLDVARFKYPPYWCTVRDLYDAMNTIDSDTGRKRGWIVLNRNPLSDLQRALFVKLSPNLSVKELAQHFSQLCMTLRQSLYQLVEEEGTTSDDVETVSLSSVSISGAMQRVFKVIITLIDKHLKGFIHISDETSRRLSSTGCGTCCEDGCCASSSAAEKQAAPEENSSAQVTKSLEALISEAEGSLVYQLLGTLIADNENNDTSLHALTSLSHQKHVLYTLIIMAFPLQEFDLLPDRFVSEMKQLRATKNGSELSREVQKVRSQMLTLYEYDSVHNHFT